MTIRGFRVGQSGYSQLAWDGIPNCFVGLRICVGNKTFLVNKQQMVYGNSHSEMMRQHIQNLYITRDYRHRVWHYYSTDFVGLDFLLWIFGIKISPMWEEDLFAFVDKCAMFLVDPHYIITSIELIMDTGSMLSWGNFTKAMYFLSRYDHHLGGLFEFFMTKLGLDHVPLNLRLSEGYGCFYQNFRQMLRHCKRLLKLEETDPHKFEDIMRRGWLGKKRGEQLNARDEKKIRQMKEIHKWSGIKQPVPRVYVDPQDWHDPRSCKSCYLNLVSIWEKKNVSLFFRSYIPNSCPPLYH